MTDHIDTVLKPNIPLSEESIKLFNELHIWCRKKGCNFTLNYNECSNEWYVVLEEPNVKQVMCDDYSLFCLAVGDAVEKLKDWENINGT